MIMARREKTNHIIINFSFYLDLVLESITNIHLNFKSNFYSYSSKWLSFVYYKQLYCFNCVILTVLTNNYNFIVEKKKILLIYIPNYFYKQE